VTRPERLVPLAGHPRAAPAIRRARALAGLAGFGLAALAGFRHGAPLAETLERALAAGVAANLAAWALSLLAWKRLLVGEATAAARRARARRDGGGGA